MSLFDHAWTILTIYIYFFLSCTPHSLGCFFLSAYALGSQWLQFTGLVAIRVREVVEERDYNRLQGARLLREFQDVPSWMVPHGSTWFHMVPRLASKVPGDFVFPPTPTNWWLCIFHFSGRVQANPGQGRPQLQFDDVVWVAFLSCGILSCSCFSNNTCLSGSHAGLVVSVACSHLHTISLRISIPYLPWWIFILHFHRTTLSSTSLPVPHEFCD